MKIITKTSKKIATKNIDGSINGYLVPLYNVNDAFYPEGLEPKQVYLTAISPGNTKGPHLHHIRTWTPEMSDEYSADFSDFDF